MEWVSGTSPDRVYLEVTYCITYLKSRKLLLLLLATTS